MTVHYIFILTLTARTYLFDTSNIITSITCYLRPFPGPHQFVYPLPSHTVPLDCHLFHPVGTSHILSIHSRSLTCFGILLEDEDDNISFKFWNHLFSDKRDIPTGILNYTAVKISKLMFYLGSLTCLQS
jgi:hypothetical protein